MLNLKKLIASIAAITVAFSTVAFAATYTDVAEDSAYYEAVESLGKLGIVTGYEDGSYKPEEVVTRAEMAALVARIQGYEETAKGSANTVFTDVPSSHWASGYIAQASNQGIINGYGDGTYGPEDPVLYEQAVKMIMATLGYTPFAEQNGSYPTGYLSAASRYEVTKGVSNAVIGTGANRGTVAQLLANAIDTPLMGQSKWSTDGTIEYTIYDGIDAVYKTLMSENLGVTKLKGIVKANSVTNIEAPKNIDTTKLPAVTIDITGNFDTNNKDFAPTYNAAGVFTGYAHGGEFLVGESDAEAFLGKAVVFYVVENEIEDKYEILSIAEDSTKNDILTFTLDQFDVLEGTIVGTANNYTVLKYYRNATDKSSTKVAVDKDMVVVYNNEGGVAKTTALSSTLNGTPTAGTVAANGAEQRGGQITLIDNDGVAGYDVAFVEVATTAVVKKATEDGVSFKKGVLLPTGEAIAEIEIDLEDENKVVVFEKDGEEIAYTDLVEWDVLSIIADVDTANYVKVDVIGTSIVGTVSSTKSHPVLGTGYTIDGKVYYVAEGAFGMTGLGMGEGGTFFIDKYGKIAALNEDTALATGVAGNYGFVTKTVVDSDPIDGKTVTIQMITANGVEVFDLASSVTYNKADGTSPTIKPETAGATDTNATTFFGSTLKGSVIKYTKNSNDKINTITIANHDDKFETGVAASGAYDADNNKINTMYVDADATIFFVDFKLDGTGAPTTDYDTDKCIVGALSDLEDKTPYVVAKAYADSKAIDNNIIVINGGMNQASPTTGVAVITGIAISEVEGDQIYVVEYTMNGEDYTAETVAKAELGAPYNSALPTIGDVVKVKVGSNGKITALTSVWNLADGVRTAATAITVTPSVPNMGSATSGEFVAAGYATNYKESSEEITINGNSYKLSKAENVYVIDASGRSVTVKNGSSASYKYHENLYSDTHKSTIKVNGTDVAAYTNMTKSLTAGSTWLEALGKYTDCVFVRLYDGKVKDVVIVKAVDKVTVSQGAEIVVGP